MNKLLSDEAYIQLTIELAKKGQGKVSPNPLVGAVIVKNGTIIGVGYHARFGENHAEINAINNCKDTPEGSILFVNLEPCVHFGKTPPCTNSIIAAKISKVVIGTLDPNPLVAGKGVEKLKTAGIKVVTGVLEKECIELNKFFFKYIKEKKPYINLKIAQTLDAKIADNQFQSKWITSAEARTCVHEMRNDYDAVLIGSNTVRIDNPELSVRFSEGRNPKRIILNKNLDLDINRKIFQNSDNNTIIVCSNKNIEKTKKIAQYTNLGIKLLFVEENNKGNLKLNKILKNLYDLGINSVMVEGGSRIFSSFVKKQLFDELSVFISSKLLGTGINAFSNIGINKLSDALNLRLISINTLGDDVLLIYKRI
ncbi:MAG: bifunctional diaminohydroxyphosphoribosylaminopyrimidine deaminase/5-amino-6-(5-phosphoribosylamino)uracil reductase RibD [bacterium]